MTDKVDHLLRQIDTIAPLIPRGDMGIMIIGKPLRSSQVSAYERIKASAKHWGARNSEGTVTFSVRFDGTPCRWHPAPSQDVSLGVGIQTIRKRLRYLALLVVFSIIMYAALIVMLKRVRRL